MVGCALLLSSACNTEWRVIVPLELQAYVIYDNKCNPNFTVLEVEVQDYPGARVTLQDSLTGRHR